MTIVCLVCIFYWQSVMWKDLCEQHSQFLSVQRKWHVYIIRFVMNLPSLHLPCVYFGTCIFATSLAGISVWLMFVYCELMWTYFLMKLFMLCFMLTNIFCVFAFATEWKKIVSAGFYLFVYLYIINWYCQMGFLFVHYLLGCQL